MFWNLKPLFLLVLNRFDLWYHSIPLAVICCHSLLLVVPLLVTGCHSLSLVVPLVVTRFHSMYHSSVFLQTIAFCRRNAVEDNNVKIKCFPVGETFILTYCLRLQFVYEKLLLSTSTWIKLLPFCSSKPAHFFIFFPTKTSSKFCTPRWMKCK